MCRLLTLLLAAAHVCAAQRLPSREKTRLVVVAGAGKCGTNALAHHISQVAGFRITKAVAVAQRKLNGFPGEVNYPCELIGATTKTRKAKGGERPPYARCLQRSRRSRDLALDKSPNYLGDPNCAWCLKRAYPEARVFATICQVASRLWSRQNHVNRDRKADEPDGDLSKTTDWPQHIVAVAKQQLEKLEKFGWNGTAACRTGHATHVCKVLATSRWHHQVKAFMNAFGPAQFDLWLMEELLTRESADIQAHLRYKLGLKWKNPNATRSKRKVVVHSNANYINYKLEQGNSHYLELKRLLDNHFANDTARLKNLLPTMRFDKYWGENAKPMRPGQRKSWEAHSY